MAAFETVQQTVVFGMSAYDISVNRQDWIGEWALLLLIGYRACWGCLYCISRAREKIVHQNTYDQ
jgi:hypothetical protein